MSKDTADYWANEGFLAQIAQQVGREFPPDYPYALECYNRALAIDPRHGRAHLGRGIVYYRLKQYQRALDDLDHATPDPEEPELDQVYRARCYLELQKFDKALEVSNKRITAFEERTRQRRKFFKFKEESFDIIDPSYYLLQARAYAGKKDYKKASEAFGRIWELSRKFPVDSDLILACRYYEGEMYLERGDYQEACNAFDFVLDSVLSPSRPSREWNLSLYPNLHWSPGIDTDTLRRKRDEACR